MLKQYLYTKIINVRFNFFAFFMQPHNRSRKMFHAYNLTQYEPNNYVIMITLIKRIEVAYKVVFSPVCLEAILDNAI